MLKLQYFGHLMWRADSFKKTLMLGKIEGRRRRGQQRMRWLDGIPTQWTWIWTNSRMWWRTGKPGILQSTGLQRHDWSDWTTTEKSAALSHFSCVWLCVTPQTAAHQAPPSLGFSRQEHWSGLPFPSPMHESEKWREVAQSCPTLATPWTAARQASLSITNSRNLLKHINWVGDAIQPYKPLSSPSPHAFSLSQHQGLFKWVTLKCLLVRLAVTFLLI